MSDLGHCSDPSCTEPTGRLFDCVHHCAKLVCLRHLIEHDRLIDRNQESLGELRQLWTTYSNLVDETKLQVEFEQRLKKHQQLTRDVTDLCEGGSNDLEQYRVILEKLRRDIEQEGLHGVDSGESILNLEQVKDEPIDEVDTYEEMDLWDVSLSTEMEKLKKETKAGKSNSIANDSMTDQPSDDETNYTTRSSTHDNSTNHPRSVVCSPKLCPFRFDGAFGLTEQFHGLYLCPQGKYYHDFTSHLHHFHQFTKPAMQIIRRALKSNEDPSRKILFAPDDIAIDRIRRLLCPFSENYHGSFKPTNTTGRYCQRGKPQLAYGLRTHLVCFHHIRVSDAQKLICKLKSNAERQSK